MQTDQQSIELNPDGTFPYKYPKYESTSVTTSTYVQCFHHRGWFDRVYHKWLGIEWGSSLVFVCEVCKNIIQDKKTVKELHDK
jgi:hypothetical protein